MMRRKSFTLVELLIVVVVIGILATIAIPAYRNFKEDANSKVCETNLKALQAGYNICIMEKGVVPACLSEIPEAVLEKAFADLLKEKGAWKIRLAYFISDLGQGNLAYAAPFYETVARGNLKLISCPSDPTSPEKTGGTGISYGVNNLLKVIVDIGINDPTTARTKYNNLSNNLVLIGDYKPGAGDDPEAFRDPSLLEQRHKTYGFLLTAPTTYGQGVTKGGKKNKIKGSPSQNSCQQKMQNCNTEEQRDNYECVRFRQEHPNGCED
jgi:prepilin-type N-terminal cleavage/methylation domain-containing protein